MPPTDIKQNVPTTLSEKNLGGRPRTCACGACGKCLKRDRERARYQALSIDERRELIARRDPERVRAASRDASRRRPRTGYVSRPGPLNPTWKGDDAGVAAKRLRARAVAPDLGACESCGAPAVDRHHVDGDVGHNDAANIRRLCRRCHMATDGRLERNLANGRTARPAQPCTDCGRLYKPRRRGLCSSCWERTYRPSRRVS